MSNKRKAYFIMPFPNHNGIYQPCIAVEGEPGYHQTDWNYGENQIVAQSAVDRLNERLGLTPGEAALIQASTMGRKHGGVEVRVVKCECGCNDTVIGVFIDGKPVEFSDDIQWGYLPSKKWMAWIENYDAKAPE